MEPRSPQLRSHADQPTTNDDAMSIYRRTKRIYDRTMHALGRDRFSKSVAMSTQNVRLKNAPESSTAFQNVR